MRSKFEPCSDLFSVCGQGRLGLGQRCGLKSHDMGSSHKFDDFRLNIINKNLQVDLDFNTSDLWLHLDLSLLTWKYLRFKCMLFK